MNLSFKSSTTPKGSCYLQLPWGGTSEKFKSSTTPKGSCYSQHPLETLTLLLFKSSTTPEGSCYCFLLKPLLYLVFKVLFRQPINHTIFQPIADNQKRLKPLIHKDRQPIYASKSLDCVQHNSYSYYLTREPKNIYGLTQKPAIADIARAIAG